MKRPFHYQMIKEAINNLRGIVSYAEIIEYIKYKWPDGNSESIKANINAFTVNSGSRINYGNNKKPRKSNTNSPYDLLFKTDIGRVEKYNSVKHGIWEIYIDEKGKPLVRQSSI